MSQQSQTTHTRYVLVTAAYNEEKLIEGLIRSIIAQTLPPLKWIVVSDGSTDRTDEIVRSYAASHPFIQLVRQEKNQSRDYGKAQARAIQRSFASQSGVPFEYFGNLDADITLDPDYFERLIAKFTSDPRLGLAGGFIQENYGKGFQVRPSNNVRSVPLGVQFFRRECYEAIGGYLPLNHGGSDWHAEVSVRMKGWNVESFQDIRVFHHRPTGTAGRIHKYRFQQGMMDFSVGSDPLFEIAKCARWLTETPRVTGAAARMAGFLWSYASGKKMAVSEEFVAFLRKDQRSRLLRLSRC